MALARSSIQRIGRAERKGPAFLLNQVVMYGGDVDSAFQPFEARTISVRCAQGQPYMTLR